MTITWRHPNRQLRDVAVFSAALLTGSASDSCAAQRFNVDARISLGLTVRRALAGDGPGRVLFSFSVLSGRCPLFGREIGFFAWLCVRVMARSLTRDFFYFYFFHLKVFGSLTLGLLLFSSFSPFRIFFMLRYPCNHLRC